MKLLNLFSIVAGVLGFVVDAVTMLSWFFDPASLSRAISLLHFPIIGISISAETATLVVLLYTLIVFGILSFKGKGYALIAGAVIPFLLLWGNLFYNLDAFWVVLGSFAWIDLYYSIILTDIDIMSFHGYDLLETFSLVLKYIVEYNWIGVGLTLLKIGGVLTPLAAAWLHERFNLGWLESFGLGFIVGNAGLIAALLLVAIFAIIIGILSLCIRFLKQIRKPSQTKTS